MKISIINSYVHQEKNALNPNKNNTRVLAFCIIRALLITAILFPLIGCVDPFAFQRKMMYYPKPYQVEYPDQIGSWKKDIVTFDSSDGVQNAFGLHHDNYSSPISEKVSKPRLWVCFHGNASLAMDWTIGHLKDFEPDHDIRFLLVDYPGYGLNEGSPTRNGIIKNGQKALDNYLSKNTLNKSDVRIGVVGYSMGAAAAMEFASREEVEDVILFAPFTSILDMSKRMVPWPFYHISIDRFNNKKRLEEVIARQSIPSITIYHGLNDKVIPAQMGEELAQLAPNQIELIIIENQGHNGLVGAVQDDFFKKLNQ